MSFILLIQLKQLNIFDLGISQIQFLLSSNPPLITTLSPLLNHLVIKNKAYPILAGINGL
jgi:hypothetical protein